MRHLKEIDEEENTVIMVQVENEIGMLPVARDYHLLANEKFHNEVPDELIEYLESNKENLAPEFFEVWAEKGFKTEGTWEKIFGEGSHTDEIFMAWYYSKYANAITKAGKDIFPLPMYLNAALIRPGREPGTGYPSAGPLPHLMDIWKAAGSSIDFFSPDIYFPNFKHWADLYTRQGNPLFIPEHRFDSTAAAKALYTFGHYEGMGFAPFSIESTDHPENEPLGKVYHLVSQLDPVIAEHQGQNKIEGVLLDKENRESVFQLGNYEFTFRHSYTLGYEGASQNDTWDLAGAVIVQADANEFYIAGSGVVTTFKNVSNPELNVGILKVDEGKFEENKWKVIRHLNGDQTHQGRHVRIFYDNYSIQRIELYNYE